MRHFKKGKQLGRVARQRKALLRSLTIALIERGKIKTTLVKAKVLRPYVEKIVTEAKRGGLNSIRELRKNFNEKSVKDLTEKWAPLFIEREGGCTRIIKTGLRISDAAPMAFIEFVEQPSQDAKKSKGGKKKVAVSDKSRKKVEENKKAKA